MEPAVSRQKLVGIFPRLEEIDQLLELRWIFRADVGCLAKKVLGVLDASHLAIDSLIPIARVDDDGANNQPCRSSN